MEKRIMDIFATSRSYCGSSLVNRAFRMSKYPKKLYYYTVPIEVLFKRHPDLIDGDGEITTVIDVRPYHDTKKEAILCHQTQRYSIERIFDFAGGGRSIPEEELFILVDTKMDYELDGVETDFFKGID